MAFTENSSVGIAFTVRQTFSGSGGPIEDTTNGIDTFPTGLTLSEMDRSFLQYKSKADLGLDTSYSNASAAKLYFKGKDHTMDIDDQYHGQKFAITDNTDNYTIIFTFNKGAGGGGTQTAELCGYGIGVGPEIRRKWTLGYI